jgi:AICAR transformylase/IMP cyclohydrolase PurH
LRQACFVNTGAELTPLACAYARARGADRVSSYGDWAALSDECDAATARLLQAEVSDGVIAPGYTGEALDLLKRKRKGGYNIVRIDPDYTPPAPERRELFGITFEQDAGAAVIGENLLENIPTRNQRLSAGQKRDLLVALIVLKYTQSNSVCYVKEGQAIGVGAGQQSRIHCTRLAGGKADLWHLRQHPQVLALPFADGIGRPDRDNAVDSYLTGEDDLLADGAWQRVFTRRPPPLEVGARAEYLAGVDGVALGSDAFFPFGDNIERARRSGVTCIAQPGGSIRDDHVIAACDKYGMVMAFTGLRLFTH